MSFGRRLRLFFIGIVAIPIVVLAVLVLQVSQDSREGKADARIAAGLNTARTVYDEALAFAPAKARRIGRRAGNELDAMDAAALRALAEREVRRPSVAAVTIAGPGGEVVATAGPAGAIGAGESEVRSSDGSALGSVRVATLAPGAFLDRIHALTSSDVALVSARGVAGSTTRLGGAELPGSSATSATDVDLPAGSVRAAALALDGAPAGTRLVVLVPIPAGFIASEPLVALALAIFFLVAFILIALLMRSLQGRIATMLAAARRIGDGDFDGRVPVEGNDEMAGLAREMNRMSIRLGEQMDELRRQRVELDESVKRIGEAFASGLDREAMLGLVVETAVSSCDAEAGRVALGDGGEDVATKGPLDGLDEVLTRAARAAAEVLGGGSASDGDAHATAHSMVDHRDGVDVLCTMAVARRGAAFSGDERVVLRYLVRQTITSIENVGLHERVAEQAFTDGLTGIANQRQFSEWLEREVARVARYGGELSLVLLDIDDFKRVNDTFGHLQGDRVLARIGKLLEDGLRGIDLAARYGGEEFVLGLPETPREGAIHVAERIRGTIEASEIEGVDGGEPISVTASFGVGTIPADGADPETLFDAADRALYRAKGTGKNRVVATATGEQPVSPGSQASRRT